MKKNSTPYYSSQMNNANPSSPNKGTSPKKLNSASAITADTTKVKHACPMNAYIKSFEELFIEVFRRSLILGSRKGEEMQYIELNTKFS